MAIFTRRAGDAKPVNNVDQSGTTGVIVASGLTKNPTAFKVVLANSQAFTAAEMATGGAVETILRIIGQDSTVVMYQAEAGDQLSVLCESIGSNVTTIATRIQALGNIGAAANVYGGPGVTISSASGFKLV